MVVYPSNRKAENEGRKYIIRKVYKLSGIRHTIVIYSKNGIMHTVTKGE